MEQKKLLTKLTTKVSTRTMLLVALGLIIIGSVAFGGISLLQKTVFNVSQAGIYTGVPWYSIPYSTPYTSKSGQKLLKSVVYSGQDGSANLAVPAICQRLKDKGIIKYDIDFSKSKAVNIAKGYCPKKGAAAYQAYNTKTSQFFNGSCWGGHDIYTYSQVNCAIKAPYTPPYTSPYTQPYTYASPYTTPYSPSYNAPNYDYRVIYQSPYSATMKIGSVRNVWVEVKNTGKKTWYSWGNNIVRLGSGSMYGAPYQQRGYYSEFANSDWISPDRPTTMTNSVVMPGWHTRFQFNLKAPMTPGLYRAYFTPVVDGISGAWMKDIGMFWQINVVK